MIVSAFLQLKHPSKAANASDSQLEQLIKLKEEAAKAGPLTSTKPVSDSRLQKVSCLCFD